MPIKETTLMLTTLETSDTALYNWVNELHLRTNTNDGFKEVPPVGLVLKGHFKLKTTKNCVIVWANLLPLVTVNRDSVSKDPNFKGSFQAELPETNDYKGGAITIRRKIKTKHVILQRTQPECKVVMKVVEEKTIK